MRLKTLNGAPLPQNLDFQEQYLLAPDECILFAAHTEPTQLDDDIATLKWRCLGAKDAQLRTGWSQPYLPESARQYNDLDLSISIPNIEQGSTFLELSTTDLDEQSTTENDFVEQSFIFHDTLLSSQVVQDAAASQETSSPSFAATSFDTTSELSSSIRVEESALILRLPPMMSVASLASLPSAQQLLEIYPQTPTVNLVCVLIAQPERREILIRKSRVKMDLFDITVADDTRSSFKVTFWLRPDSNNERSDQNQLLEKLGNIKVGDILLLRHVALTSFRNTVYGQSLHPAITRARTTIDVLMKSTDGSTVNISKLPAAVVETFLRIKKWARVHVATNNRSSRKRRASGSPQKRKPTSSFQDDSLPPDTMEAI